MRRRASGGWGVSRRLDADWRSRVQQGRWEAMRFKAFLFLAASLVAFCMSWLFYRSIDAQLARAVAVESHPALRQPRAGRVASSVSAPRQAGSPPTVLVARGPAAPAAAAPPLPSTTPQATPRAVGRPGTPVVTSPPPGAFRPAPVATSSASPSAAVVPVAVATSSASPSAAVVPVAASSASPSAAVVPVAVAASSASPSAAVVPVAVAASSASPSAAVVPVAVATSSASPSAAVVPVAVASAAPSSTPSAAPSVAPSSAMPPATATAPAAVPTVTIGEPPPTSPDAPSESTPTPSGPFVHPIPVAVAQAPGGETTPLVERPSDGPGALTGSAPHPPPAAAAPPSGAPATPPRTPSARDARRFLLGPGPSPPLVVPVDRTLIHLVLALLVVSNVGLFLVLYPRPAARPSAPDAVQRKAFAWRRALPLLMAMALLAQGCARAPDTAAGQAVFERYACKSCHSVRGEAGGVGPDLSTLGSRRTAAEIRAKVMDPAAWRVPGYPVGMMPTLGPRMTAAELDALVGFLAACTGAGR